ncbi:hypothetical protein [Dyadobacter sp. MSC1_007]|jgi:hypothetical protein|uniref:hypothetical protein n=1 Tax=Dyadobacter sp. MSC1_007 TaxID=2909264 RepID=UPI00202E598D|nr:hypothetical protein [Dyadobacter sp. MSC1_007]
MRLSEIRSLIKDDKYYIQFNTSIQPEIESYGALLKKKGVSVPILLIEDIIFQVGINQCRMLCILFLQSKIGQMGLSYIANALQLSENVTFLNEQTAQIIGEMAEDGVDGTFTLERANEIVSMTD